MQAQSTSRIERIRALKWKQLDRQRIPWIRVGQRVIRRQFAKEKRDYLTALSQGLTPAIGAARVIAAVRDQEEPWTKLLRRLYRGVAAQFGPEAVAQLTETKALSRGILDWIEEEAAQKVVDILETTRRQIRQVLEEGVESGATITDMSRSIEEFSGFSRVRALRVASCEVVNAMGASQTIQVSEEAEGLVLKSWLSSRDAAVRDSHDDLDGQEVPVDEPYETRDHYKLRWPADSGLGAPASEVVNCRCSQVFREAN